MLERIQQLHVGTRGFDGDHIGIHISNRRNDVVKLRVAHVGVNLGAVLHTVGGDTE
ncbi:hypothetical protein D3C72_2555190 [compost metagenome]